ncbi:hypothetical protein [Pseudobacillus badius]|uniref:hypothetical protein n=1 Tax=Bacillus badius TaxID=1455 RepID=UPI003D33CF36
MHKFNGWNEAKIKIFGSERPLFRNLYTKEQLVMIARKHSTYFTSQNTWSRYAAQHGLPNAHVFINHFNSWNEAKASIFPESKAVLQQKRSFSKENLIETAKKYQDHFTSIKAWDSFAVQHDLPRSGVFIKHFQSWNHAKNKYSTTQQQF